MKFIKNLNNIICWQPCFLTIIPSSYNSFYLCVVFLLARKTKYFHVNLDILDTDGGVFLPQNVSKDSKKVGDIAQIRRNFSIIEN